ncbi:hypothetical protein F5Y02DRAFT_398352 [Annulohypoxylon stygium]|nr:hypothetical protein F5Y02DRAFT_398352 [Annulohypoxylon stygium]
MERLSPEVMALIAAHLCDIPRPPFRIPGAPRIFCAPYAVISRRWQDFVEPWTFSSIELKDIELDTFAAIFADSRRRALLRHLTYYITLPTYGKSRHDFAQNQAAMNDSILTLLNVLKDWDDAGARLKLRVVTVHYDHTAGGFLYDNIRTGTPSRYLMFDEVELPTVHCVASLDITANPDRALHPTAMCQLAGTFLLLEKLNFEVLDPVNRWRRMRKDHRLALAAGLTALNLPKLTHLSLNRTTTTDVYNHNFECGDLEEDGIDALNDALRKLSQTPPLTDLVLTGALISPDLFRSRRTADPDSSEWPTLRNISVKAEIIAPSGQWYYTGDPDAVEPGVESTYGDSSETSESDDEDHGSRDDGVRPTHPWRTQPDPDLFNALVKDMAGAVLRMPQLRTGSLDIGPRYGPAAEIILKCAEVACALDDRPDWVSDSEEEKITRRWHAWVSESTKWKIPKDVKVLWAEWLGDSGKSAISCWPPPPTGF